MMAALLILRGEAPDFVDLWCGQWARPEVNRFPLSRNWPAYGRTCVVVAMYRFFLPMLSTEALGLGHPIWGTHEKMTGMNEQELRESMRLKHHSQGLKKSTAWLISFVSGPGDWRFKSSLPDHSLVFVL